MIRKIEFGDQWPENIPVESDPVRPELDRRYRHTGGREVYTNEGAILCVAYCDKVPRTLLELSYWVLYSIQCGVNNRAAENK